MFVLNSTYKKKCNRGINDNEYESKCLETSFVWKIINKPCEKCLMKFASLLYNREVQKVRIVSQWKHNGPSCRTLFSTKSRYPIIKLCLMIEEIVRHLRLRFSLIYHETVTS